jgi:hypothetical protein
MWDQPEEPQEELTLSLRQVSGQPTEDPAVFRLRMETTRGPINALFHPVEGGTGAVVFAGGAMGGLDGPADAIYSRLPAALADARVSTLRIDYRIPNDMRECTLDVLAGCSFLKGVGASDVVLVGHSFGAAVVISAGELSPIVRAVASLSPQLHGTRTVENLGRPLLLVHGMVDSVLNHEASEDIYRRALEPKRIVLYAEAGHSLIQAKDQLWELLLDWIPARLAGAPMDTGREEHEHLDSSSTGSS